MSGVIQTMLSRSVFSGRNIDKAVNGSDVDTQKTGEVDNSDGSIRGAVGAIQLGAVLANTSKLDGVVGKTAESAVDAVKATKVGGNAVNFLQGDSVGRTVNGLLIGASIARVLSADDKEKAAVHETCAMGGMFAAENLMKTKVVDSTMNKMLDFIPDDAKIGIGKFKVKTSVIKELLKGTAFVAASINGFDAGSKLGDVINEVA